jgi:hypothetical protein
MTRIFTICDLTVRFVIIADCFIGALIERHGISRRPWKIALQIGLQSINK